MKRFAVRLIVVALAAVTSIGALPGCATTSGAAGKATRAAADVLLPPTDEEKLGAQFSDQVEAEAKLHPDPQVQAYIQRLGKMTVKAAGDRVPKGIKFEFHVIDDPNTVNAFAGPGGQVYFYTGLLLEADNTAEVLGVMCHEVAHVTERHVAERLVTAYGVQALTSAALGDNPGLVAQLGGAIATQGFMLKYSRDHEREADSVGLKYMLRTSYSPQGFVSFFQKLEAMGGSPPVFLSSHPPPGERVNNLQKALQGKKNLSDNLGADEHKELLQRLKSPSAQK